MKSFIIAFVCLVSLSSSAQNGDEKPGGVNWKAPYTLATPAGWSVGRSVLSSQNPYNGIEDLRLMPGWDNPASEEYWTYASLWYLDQTSNISDETLGNSLTAYFTRLLKVNMDRQKIPANMVLPVKTWITELVSDGEDLKTYYGAVSMLDFKERKPISLNCTVHVRGCAEQNKTIIFFEMSPRPLTDSIWKGLDQLWKDFACSNQPYSTN